MKSWLVFVLCGLLLFSGGLPVFSQESQVVEVREAQTPFHRSVIQSAIKASKAGEIRRTDVVRLRVAMMSPAFRQHAEDLAVMQMSASGSDNTPIGADGKVDRASIDWEKLLAFLEKLLPIILQLIDAFGMTFDQAFFVACSMVDVDPIQFVRV